MVRLMNSSDSLADLLLFIELRDCLAKASESLQYESKHGVWSGGGGDAEVSTSRHIKLSAFRFQEFGYLVKGILQDSFIFSRAVVKSKTGISVEGIEPKCPNESEIKIKKNNEINESGQDFTSGSRLRVLLAPTIWLLNFPKSPRPI